MTITRHTLQDLALEWDQLQDQLRLTTLRLDTALVRVKELENKGAHVEIQGNKDVTITRRQQEILKWATLGKTNIEIGMILSLSPITVKQHMATILQRLDVPTRTAAVAKALSLGLIKT